MTDPYVTLVFFAAVLLIVCGAGAIAEHISDRKQRSRDLRRRLRRYGARS